MCCWTIGVVVIVVAQDSRSLIYIATTNVSEIVWDQLKLSKLRSCYQNSFICSMGYVAFVANGAFCGVLATDFYVGEDFHLAGLLF